MLTQEGVQLSHVSSISLPPEALDRGVPAEPLKMARLIQDFCAEKKIPAHRVAVVLPPELAFQRLVELPALPTTDDAREFVLNPANGLQIPFPLTQTDFDLFPVSMPGEQPQSGGKRLYMLTAIPEVLVDPIVEMLQAADLELQLLELGSHSQLRNHAAELVTLGQQQVDLVLELLPDGSNLMLVSGSGLLGSERLASIRNLPSLDLDAEQLAVAVGSGLSAEDLLFKDENYLPISDLDLRVLVADLKASFERFYCKLPDVQIRRLILAGVNSSHPLLTDLLAEMLGLPIVLSRSIDVPGLAELSMSDLLLHSALGRLTGLALGLLPKDQLLACSLGVHGLSLKKSQRPDDAVAIADLLHSSEAQMHFDLLAVSESSSVLASDEQKKVNSLINVDANIEAQNSFSSSSFSADGSLIVPAKSIDSPLDLETGIDQAEIVSDHLSTVSSMNEESLEIFVEATPVDSVSEQEWPSIVPPPVVNQSDSGVVDIGSSLEEQWPSINSPASGVVDDSISESEWPSIASKEEDKQVVEEVLDSEDDPSEWPTIVLNDALELKESGDVLEAWDDPAVGDDEQLQKAESDQRPPLGGHWDESSETKEIILRKNINDADPSEQVIPDQNEDLIIPDLSLSSEKVDIQLQSKNDQPSSDELDLADGITDLGELRFAEDGN